MISHNIGPLDRRGIVLGLAGSLVAPSALRAQSFPSESIQLVVPNPPGGALDLVGRIVAEKLQNQLGRPVVIDNRPGAGGDTGTEAVIRAEPDGHTLLIAAIALTLKPALYRNLRFDPRKDITAVARLASQPMIIVSRPKLPVQSLQDFVDLAKASPGKLTFGTPGPGTPQHFGAEMLSAETSIKMVHVPYRGAAQAMTDLVAEQIDLYYATETSALGHIKTGKMRPLAVTGDKRLASLPDVKSVVELGLHRSSLHIWYGLFAPPRLPSEILARLSAELQTMAQGEDYRTRLATLGLDNARSSPEEMKAQIESEIPRWQEVARAAGIQPQD